MLTDPVLAILALLFLWLFVRLRDTRVAEETEPGRRAVKVRGRKGVKVIETLPPRPLAFGAFMSVPDGDAKYKVDLSELTCTCPDFGSRRADLPPEAIGRICSHLSQALKTTGATSSMDDLVRTIVESGPTLRTYFQVPIGAGGSAAVGHAPGSDQLDVFVPADGADGVDGPESPGAGAYRRYGYSRAGRRWLDDHAPPEGEEIAGAIPELPWGEAR